MENVCPKWIFIESRRLPSPENNWESTRAPGPSRVYLPPVKCHIVKHMFYVNVGPLVPPAKI